MYLGAALFDDQTLANTSEKMCLPHQQPVTMLMQMIEVAAQVTGEFGNHDAVRICDSAGQEVGRGLSNYAREEVAKLMVLHACPCC